MRRRMKLVLLRIARSLVAAALVLILYSLLRRESGGVLDSTSDQVLLHLNSLLNDAVSASLLRERQISLAETVLNDTYSELPASNIMEIMAIQDSVACFVEKGAWERELIPLDTIPSPRGFKRFRRVYRPQAPCFSSTAPSLKTPSNFVDMMCSLLSGKKLLLVGPETTFYLHSLWLHALESHESRSHGCLGPEFCTFHHICQPPSNETQPPTKERFKKLPRVRDLISTRSSVLRYILSTSLHASSNPKDPAYTLPVVDPLTNVRVQNTYWLHQVRKNDITVLNRGPIPAPAWTYDIPGGNWSFLDDLPTLLHVDDDPFGHISQALRILNGALHITLTAFLPNLLRTLGTLYGDPLIQSKVLVWHGSWYIQPQCSNAVSLNVLQMPEALLQTQKQIALNPWSLYYNAQVYMHNRILRDLLPHYDVIFLPQTIPFASFDIRDSSDTIPSHLGTMEKREPGTGRHGNDCLRYPFASPGGKAIEAAFLGGLVRILARAL